MELQPGENLIFSGHPSWRSILDFYFKGLVLIVVGAGIAALVTLISDKVDWGISGATAGVLFVVVLIVGLVKRTTTTYTITDRRLHIRRGVFTRVTRDTRLERVQNVNTRQSLLERMLRVGTVDFDTAGTEDSDFSFVGVASPRKVVEAVDKAQREREATAQAPAPSPPAPPAQATDL
jgi:uncharacterized membrane protein YdbT with pleckstrin-like domain